MTFCSRKRTGRKGFTLLEMLSVMLLFGAMLALTATMLTSGFRVERSSAAAYRRLVHQHALEDQFRADVAEATATPEAWEDFEASPDCLILKNADGRHVLYHWHANRLTRLEHDGDQESKRELPLGDARFTVEFIRDGRLITLRLEESRKTGVVLVHEMCAALGGGVR